MDSGPFIFAVVDWGTITVKDLVYALLMLAALTLGHRRVWCWFYQLEDERSMFSKLLELERENHKATLQQLREDFKLQLEAAEERADSWRELVMDGRTLVKQSVSAVAELASRHGA